MISNFSKSEELKKQAKEIIPGLTQTFSKGPSAFMEGASPVYVTKGDGCYLWDVDGNKYLDFTSALGPVILGYNNREVNNAIEAQLESGIVFTIAHTLELELGKELCELIPSAEMVRYGKNGSDATTGAVRLARAYTSRDKIACSGYHGWHDWYIGTTSRNYGIPKAIQDLTLTFSYNDIESLENLFRNNPNEIAAVMVEPAGIEEPKDDFLQKVKDLAHENGAVFIMDEVVTGFRFSLGGAQKYFGVTPDLSCFGKAMGNGMPISALVGKREIMSMLDEVFFSFTSGGELLSIAAALATIRHMKNNDTIKKIWKTGEDLKNGVMKILEEEGFDDHAYIKGYPPRTVLGFKGWGSDDALVMKSFFQQECIKRGLLFTGAHNISEAHSNNDVEKMLKIYTEVIREMFRVKEQGDLRKELKGELLQPVFRKV